MYLNPSTVNEHDLDELVDAGVDMGGVEAIHNFYPKPHTGLRLQGSRTALGRIPIPPMNAVARPVGSVTVDNDLAGRNRDEIAITTTDLQPDPAVNGIGRIADRDRALLAAIGPDQAVGFTVDG